MMETVKVKVTQAHIDRGVRAVSDACPVFKAVEETLRGKIRIFAVTNMHVAVYDKTGNRVIMLPPSAYDFIQRFDRGDPVEPFEFPLPV